MLRPRRRTSTLGAHSSLGCAVLSLVCTPAAAQTAEAASRRPSAISAVAAITSTRESLARALRADPALELDASEASPKVLELLPAARLARGGEEEEKP